MSAVPADRNPVGRNRASVSVTGQRGDGSAIHWRVAKEEAVAFEYNGTAHAVMMATPVDLEDFAVGFTLAEEIVPAFSDIESIRVKETPLGHILDIRVDPLRLVKSNARTRTMAGRSGCGLCGVDSLEAAIRTPRRVGTDFIAAVMPPAAIVRAFASLPQHQPLNDDNRSVHAAAWVDATGTLRLVREDVGRHNALDKLIGALFRAGLPVAAGFAVVTSRCGYELVQKAAAVGIAGLASLSAPTALALRHAQAAGIRLAAADRNGGAVIFV